MAKNKRTRRTAIVPALILSAGVMSGAAVVPMLSGCGDDGTKATVAACCFDIGFVVAARGFDMSVGVTVAAQGFDMSNADAEPDAG